MSASNRDIYKKRVDDLIAGFKTLLASYDALGNLEVDCADSKARTQKRTARIEKLKSTIRLSDEELQKIVGAIGAVECLEEEQRTTATHQPYNVKTWLASHNMPPDHPAVPKSDAQVLKCPFASTSREQAPSIANNQPPPHSMPTPPETNHVFDEEAEEEGGYHAQRPRATSSMQGSISKCPIRMLDDRPPEEVAKYFEEHKHEIPRSHAICVKRYQSNEESIRRLDAKYGNLVNMIKGLGSKHQSFMPPTDENEDGHSIHTGSFKGVSAWARGLPQETKEGIADSVDIREHHFERPLHDVRVGESPTRPWGIHVPQLSSEPEASHRQPPHQQSEQQLSEKAQNGGTGHVPSSNSRSAKPIGRQKTNSSLPPPVIFNGPVFIGYPPDQAMAFLRELGTSGGQHVP